MSLRVLTCDDMTPETVETLTVALSITPAGSTTADVGPDGVGTIIDNDPPEVYLNVWVPIVRSWALTRGFALHPGTKNRYEIRYTSTQHRPPSRHVNDHGRVSGTHRLANH